MAVLTATNFLYLSPADMTTLYATVTGSVINSTYQLAWLCDGLPGRPLRAGTVNPSWGLTFTNGPINFAAAINVNLDAAGTIAITDDVTATLTMPSYAGRVPKNPFTYFTEVASANSLTVARTGNSVDVVIGQFVAGKARELERPIDRKGRRDWLTFNVQPEIEQSGHVGVTRKDLAGRTFTGSTVLTASGFDAVESWFNATNDGQLMSVVVPDTSRNDAWVVKFQRFGFEKGGPNEYFVTLTLVEYPRILW